MVVITVAFVGRAAGHVAPSVDDNNRYLKLTPFGDRVRIAYTVFFGEVPGAIERRSIDTDRDGRISDAEGHAFGVKIADQVAAALVVEVDGAAAPLPWTTVDVGMGSPEVTAGSFSIDMVGYACLASVRGHHRLVVHDRFRIPHPGETEVKVEDAPGIAIERARVGPADDPSHDYRFAGPGGPLNDDGLELQFTAGPHSTVTADATCTATATSAPRHWLRYALISGALLAACGIAARTAFARRRAARA